MIYELKLDCMGDDTVETAYISEWFIEVGGVTQEGEDLLEMTTDKAAFTVSSPKSGILREIFFNNGDEVAVDDVICNIEI